MIRRMLDRLAWAVADAGDALQDRAITLATHPKPWVRWLAVRWLGMDPKDPWKRPAGGPGDG